MGLFTYVLQLIDYAKKRELLKQCTTYSYKKSRKSSQLLVFEFRCLLQTKTSLYSLQQRIKKN